MQPEQLELPFEQQLQAALEQPETASIQALWAELEPNLVGLSDEAQLQVAARAIAQLADLMTAKAEALLAGWEQRFNPPDLAEPILSPDVLSGMLRQSMSLNLEGVVKESPLRERIEPIQSIVEEVDKAALLEVLEAESSAHDEAMAVAHDEDVTAWAAAIDQSLEQMPLPIYLVELQQALKLPLVEVWLGLLLGEGGYQLHQTTDEFYSLAGVKIDSA